MMGALDTAGSVVGHELLAEIDGEVHLVGSACADCGAVTFPAQASCPKCTGQNVTEHVLPRHGSLWAYTVQGFAPKPPYLGADGSFTPYAVGYVDLGGEVLVESRIVTDDLEGLRVGMAMELVLVPFHTRSDGEPVLTFAFAASGVIND